MLANSNILTSDPMTFQWISELLGFSIENNSKFNSQTTHIYLSLPAGRGYFLASNNSQNFKLGLHLFPAQGIIAKLFKSLLYSYPWIGLKIPFLSKINLVESGKNSILSGFRNFFKLNTLYFSISLGTPGPHRKPVIQIITPEGFILGYAKVGWNRATRRLICNEAMSINALAQLKLKCMILPNVITDIQTDRLTTLVTEPLESLAQTSRVSRPYHLLGHVISLVELANAQQRLESFRNSSFWRTIYERAAVLSAENFLPKNHAEIANKAISYLGDTFNDILPWIWSLGDYTLWNTRLDIKDNKVSVIDLEYAKPDWLPGWDLFHLIRSADQKSNLILKINRQKILQRYFTALGINLNSINKLYLAYLLDIFLEWYLTWFKIGVSPSKSSSIQFNYFAEKILDTMSQEK